MLFNYKVVDKDGKEQRGQIESANIDLATSTLQRRGFIVTSITPSEKKGFLQGELPFFNRVKMKDIVLMSKQAATLFEAQVSAVKIFELLGSNSESKTLKRALLQIADDIRGGTSISGAMAKQPEIFSTFYVSMIRAGEESGNLTQTFQFLADYLERNYNLTSKTKNALVYPAFIIFTFISVMVLMLTKVIPQMAKIITESGQEIPFYTKIVLGISNFFVHYGVFLGVFIVVAVFFIMRTLHTDSGREKFDQLKIMLPGFGNLFRKTYLARIADNLNTMLSSGIPVVRTLEIAADVVGNKVYEKILLEAAEDVKGGQTISEAFEKHEEIPQIMVQMIKVGEETGSVGKILKTLAVFYNKEVIGAVDTLIGMIEPAMIVLLGLGVGGLLMSVMVPIYQVAGSVG